MEYVTKELEMQIIHFCAPVLAGLKTAGLFSIDKKAHPFLNQELLLVKKNLIKQHISIVPICQCSTRVLLFVYNKPLLKSRLKESSIRKYLFSKGYPLDDIIGFEKNNGKNFKCCGYWAVYGNIDHARACFSAYKQCTDAMMKLYSHKKMSLAELCVAA